MNGLSRRLVPLALLVASAAAAQSNNVTQQDAWDAQRILKAETFVRPPANIERIIMAPRVDISFTAPAPDRKWFLKTAGAERGDIQAYGKPHIYLAGIPIFLQKLLFASLAPIARLMGYRIEIKPFAETQHAEMPVSVKLT